MSFLTFSVVDRRFKKELEGSRPRLYRIAYSWCHDAEMADDLAQETMARALKGADGLKDREALRGWLFKIMLNLWRESFRAKRETIELLEHHHVQQGTPEGDMVRDEIAFKVREAIENLSDNQREVVTLVDLEGFSYMEVADIVGAPVGTVMSRLHRARHALRENLIKADPSLCERAPALRRVK